jgi:hypothetical protein
VLKHRRFLPNKCHGWKTASKSSTKAVESAWKSLVARMLILTDLSTFVHSLPVTLWLGDAEEQYSNTEKNQDMVAIWLRVANFYLARSFGKITACADYEISKDMSQFTNHFQKAFD